MNINAEFIQGQQGQLFRLTRTPAQVIGHVFYLPSLFEQANQTRHMLTRSAINAYQQGFESIIVDHYGTGDSAGELNEASLALWQQDIISQLDEIKKHSTQPIILSVSLSATLLLNNALLAMIDGLILIQAEFNGKRFIQQLKRLALAADLNKPLVVVTSPEEKDVTIAGYVMDKQLLADLSRQNLTELTSVQLPCCWLEWQATHSELSTARVKQYQSFQGIISANHHCSYSAIDESKFWQSTALEIAQQCLDNEQQALITLLSAITRAKTC